MTKQEAERQIVGLEFRYLGDVQRLALNPGDVVFIKYPGHLSDAMANDIKARLSGMLQDNGVMVIDSGAEIGVLGREVLP